MNEEKHNIDNFIPNKEGVEKVFALTRDWHWRENYSLNFNDNWKLECIHREGGHEGAGEEHWIILKLTGPEHESLWEIPGWYASHDGAYLEPENMFEVEEGTKVVRVFNPKN